MAGLARVVVHVRRGGAGGPARFGQSVTGTFCPAHEDAAVVSCGLDGGRFLLSDVPFPGSTVALLKRPPFCPAKRLGEQPELALPAEVRGRGVAAGVAVLLQASTGRVLLTRRAGTLSIFPNVWVPPGGHVEPGEELLAVGLRELEEETGLRLEAGTFSWRMLGLWEVNVRLGLGGLSTRRPSPMELGTPGCGGQHPVDAFPPPTDTAAPARGAGGVALGSPPVFERVPAVRLPAHAEPGAAAPPPHRHLPAAPLRRVPRAAGGERAPDVPVCPRVAIPRLRAASGFRPGCVPARASITELSTGSSGTVQLPTATFLNTAPAEGEDVERVSTGTKFALRLWLESLGEQGRAWP
ncbi:nucleoside diphosphate-linked moiety X motif 17 isoform 2-T2 [Ciconia maguari]